MNYFDWKKALLNYYRDLDLDEKSVTIIYLIDFINYDNSVIITPDLLALKSSLPYEQIDEILNNLMTKNYVNISNKDGHMVTSLDTLKEMLFELYIADVNSNKKETEEIKELQKEIVEAIESNFSRKLLFVEKNKIKEWLNDGYRKDNILYALKEAMYKKIKSINYMDKKLLEWRKQDERTSEGYTTITDKWHKDISDTNKITDLNWVNKKHD